MEEVRPLVAQLNFRNRKVKDFRVVDFGNVTVLEFEANDVEQKHKLILEYCTGFSMSYGTQSAVETVSVIDANPMLGNIYCTIMFNNERTARVMCRKVSVE